MADDRYILCPYCGHTQQQAVQCVMCGGLFEPLSRQATQIAMGPWFIRDQKNPYKPGCSYDMIKKMAASGRLKATTIMRGPTTRQFWSIARHVPGVAHLLGHCHSCDTKVPTDAKSCPSCQESFDFDLARNELGLQYPSDADATHAQRMLNRKMRGEPEHHDKKTKATRKHDDDMKAPQARSLVLEFVPPPEPPPPEAEPPEPPPPEAEQNGVQAIELSLTAWILLALNVIAAAVAGVLLWLNLTPGTPGI